MLFQPPSALILSAGGGFLLLDRANKMLKDCFMLSSNKINLSLPDKNKKSLASSGRHTFTPWVYPKACRGHAHGFYYYAKNTSTPAFCCELGENSPSAALCRQGRDRGMYTALQRSNRNRRQAGPENGQARRQAPRPFAHIQLSQWLLSGADMGKSGGSAYNGLKK